MEKSTAKLRRFVHYVAGFLTSFAPHWWLGFIAFFSFLAYEVGEYVKLRDSFYPELREYAAGFYAGFVARVGASLFLALRL